MIGGLLGLLLRPPQWLFTRILSPVICPGAVYAVNTSAKMVALTIDDGPDRRLGEANSTQKMLEILWRHNQEVPEFAAHATFFLLSDPVQERALLRDDRQDAVVVRMISEGHEIGNHLVEDNASILLGDRFAEAFSTAHQQLTAYAEQPMSQYPQVRWLRPGVGWCDRAMAEVVSQRAAYQSSQGEPNIVLGSVWPYDTFLSWPAFSRWFIRQTMRPGSIIILHDGGSRGDNTAQMLEGLLQDLAQREYTAVPLSQLLSNGNVIARSQVLPKPIEAIRRFLIIQGETLRRRLAEQQN